MSNWSCKTSLLALKGQYSTAENKRLGHVMFLRQPLEEIDESKSKTNEEMKKMKDVRRDLEIPAINRAETR